MPTLRRGVSLTAAVLALAPGAAKAADPLTCTGYPERRQFVEAQSWWSVSGSQTGVSHGHTHVGACVPERESLAAPTSLDVRLILHDNGPTKVSSDSMSLPYVSLVAKGSTETTVEKAYFGGWSCPFGTCTKWATMTVDPAKWPDSGLQEARLRFFLDVLDPSSTKRMIASLNWQFYAVNGKPRDDVTRMPYVRGKGWYTNSNYCEADVETVPLPDAPVSGVWSPVVRVVDHGGDDVDPDHYVVTLDPDVHNGNPGTVLRDAAAPFEGPVAIDTAPLATGRHRLVVRADCPSSEGTTSGVLVVPFDVRSAPAGGSDPADGGAHPPTTGAHGPGSGARPQHAPPAVARRPRIVAATRTTRRGLAKGLTVRISNVKPRTRLIAQLRRRATILTTSRARADRDGAGRVPVKLGRRQIGRLRSGRLTIRCAVTTIDGHRTTIVLPLRVI